ncbi:MAG: nucleotidyltransferase domain-containing protein [Oscillospiraceae bacterium]|nr:nucleotidyltransferase domain-containing protein [Oscillospiraceae bacterium]
MCSKDLLNELLQELTVYAKDIFGEKLKKVILYGSFARGDYDDESDIDVMLMVDLSPEELNLYRKQINYFCSDLNVANCVFISPILQSVPLFDEWKDTLPFYQNIVREGVSVYG